MDRQIVYPGQIPLETDLLNTNRNTMLAIAKLSAAIMGTGGLVNGLVVAPTVPATLSVNVGLGEIYSLQNVDNTAYSSLPADTTDTIVKQGIQLGTVNLACPAPSTAGFSINYLIEATYADSDTGAVALPYYNATNPSQAYSGPANSGALQATARQGLVSLFAKPGIAAAIGTQVTPSVDAGSIALAVVTVANGQATIVAGNISAVVSSQVLKAPIAQQSGRLLGPPTVITATGSFTPNPLANATRVRIVGGGGAGGGASATSASQASVGSGGTSGSYAEIFIPGKISGAQAVTIGAAGVGASGAIGGSGGLSSFGGFVSCPGGAGGVTSGSTSALPAFTSPSASGFLPTTGGGALVVVQGAPCSGQGGVAVSTVFASAGTGGSTPIGIAGGSLSPATGGAGGIGAGNSASKSAAAGYGGAPGLCIVEEFS